MAKLNLFIDELGTASFNEAYSKHYIVTGCFVNEFNRNELKIKADQIKFKYWGRTNIVFRSRDIGRKIGDFKIFQEEKLFKEFQKDLFKFLFEGNYSLFTICLDKEKAKNQNWSSIKIYKETARILIKNFILSLIAKKTNGRIVIEASTGQRDFSFYEATRFYLSSGLEDIGVPFNKIQEVLTEISFVTKKNFDIEEQIADLSSYGAKLKITNKKDLSDYDKNILNMVNAKLFKIHPKTGERKKKFYSEIKSFVVLP